MQRPDTTEFLDIFLNDRPLIDTRAPVEFTKGAFPTSVSLPLMTDDERTLVGTCYKQQGQEEAIALGHQLVNGAVKGKRVKAWTHFAKQHPEGYLYCWRGGLRSQICQQWMRDAECDYPRITGGYKAMRTWLLQQFEHLCATQPLRILAGKTGCNKTGLITEQPNAVDLEGLAHHLGSSFGRRPGGQPTQLNFENALAIDFLKAHHHPLTRHGVPVPLEDESLLIGRCSLPFPFREAMNQAPVVVLNTTLEERVEHTYHNYILRKLAEWQTEIGADGAFNAFSNDLSDSLYRVRKRLGGVRFQHTNKQLQAALTAHQQGDPDAHRRWITDLLRDYYDPMYEYQLGKREERILFQGNRQAVKEFLVTAHHDH